MAKKEEKKDAPKVEPAKKDAKSAQDKKPTRVSGVIVPQRKK